MTNFICDEPAEEGSQHSDERVKELIARLKAKIAQRTTNDTKNTETSNMSDDAIHKVMRDLLEGNPDVPVLGGTGPVQMTEDEWDAEYGGALNESPLHLDRDQLAAIAESHIWTQCEDGEDQDYLINGAFSSNRADAEDGRLAFNVVGHWLSVKPWDTGKSDAGDIHAKWGSGPDRYEDQDDHDEEGGIRDSVARDLGL